MSDVTHFLATLAFWCAFAALECLVLIPLAGALSGQGEGAALALVVAFIVCLVMGAVIAAPRYNAMMKAMDRR